jgi:hypothetical protein
MSSVWTRRKAYEAAMRKREMEQAIRAQGHSAGYARAVVAAHFRELNSEVESTAGLLGPRNAGSYSAARRGGAGSPKNGAGKADAREVPAVNPAPMASTGCAPRGGSGIQGPTTDGRREDPPLQFNQLKESKSWN